MKHPIIQALDWPEVKCNFMKPFDLTDTLTGTRTLTFENPRTKDFPLLNLAFKAAKNDNCHPIAFNAANEIAAGAFIEGKINFGKIAEIVEKVMEGRQDWNLEVRDISDILKQIVWPENWQLNWYKNDIEDNIRTYNSWNNRFSPRRRTFSSSPCVRCKG